MKVGPTVLPLSSWGSRVMAMVLDVTVVTVVHPPSVCGCLCLFFSVFFSSLSLCLILSLFLQLEVDSDRASGEEENGSGKQSKHVCPPHTHTHTHQDTDAHLLHSLPQSLPKIWAPPFSEKGEEVHLLQNLQTRVQGRSTWLVQSVSVVQCVWRTKCLLMILRAS